MVVIQLFLLRNLTSYFSLSYYLAHKHSGNRPVPEKLRQYMHVSAFWPNQLPVKTRCVNCQYWGLNPQPLFPDEGGSTHSAIDPPVLPFSRIELIYRILTLFPLCLWAR